MQPEDMHGIRGLDLRMTKQAFGWSPNTMYPLLTTPEGNVKSQKAAEYGYSVAMLMLHADRIEADINPLGVEREYVTVVTCPHATHGPEGCVDNCIMYTGRGRRNNKGTPTGIHIGRARRTRWLATEPHSFIVQLVREMQLHVSSSKNNGLVPVVRLNGTSDLRWELIVPWLFQILPPHELTFIDYTKWPLKARSDRPSHYHLAKSVQASKESIDTVFDELNHGHISMIIDDPSLLIDTDPALFINADAHDLWIAEATAQPVIGLLRPKKPLTKTHPQVFKAREIYRKLYQQ